MSAEGYTRYAAKAAQLATFQVGPNHTYNTISAALVDAEFARDNTSEPQKVVVYDQDGGTQRASRFRRTFQLLRPSQEQQSGLMNPRHQDSFPSQDQLP